MASMASAARDIQATSGRDNLTAVAARSVPVTRSHPLPLPTPPNSISPGLPPHGIRAQLLKAKLDPAVPPLDLHDAPTAVDVPGNLGSPPDDAAGALTPALLAKYHLPEILLNHGPLAIRHIMGYLTTSVPGFAGIAPGKARRLVVGGLEGRGGSGEGGGLDGDVIFEKVGWGRWDARRKGQPSRDSAAQMVAEASLPYSSGIPIANGPAWSNMRTRIGGASSETRGDSPVFSHDDHGFHTHDDGMDNMSLDGSRSPERSAVDDMDMDDPEDITDEEDWAAIGAAGLRAASYSKSASARGVFTTSRFQSTSMNRNRAPQPSNIDYAKLAATPDPLEREAIEALLRLSSV